MSESTKVFKHPERSAYELGHLLRKLPAHLHREELTDQQHLEVEAADLHALNSSGTLLHGLQSLGRVMWSASVNEAYPVDAADYGKVGVLVTEIALQLQFLDEFRQSVTQYEMRAADTQKSAAERAAVLVALREETDAQARAAGVRSMSGKAGAA